MERTVIKGPDVPYLYDQGSGRGWTSMPHYKLSRSFVKEYYSNPCWVIDTPLARVLLRPEVEP